MMNPFTMKEKKALVKNIRKYRDRVFPGRGGVKLLAKAIGVSPQLLSQWMHEKRMPPPTRLHAIATVLGMDVRDLCGRRRGKTESETPSDLPEITQGQVAAIDTLILLLRHSKQVLLGKADARRHKQGVQIIKDMLEKELNDA